MVMKKPSEEPELKRRKVRIAGKMLKIQDYPQKYRIFLEKPPIFYRFSFTWSPQSRKRTQ